MFIALLFTLLVLVPSPLILAEDRPRVEWTMEEVANAGPYQQTYDKLRWEIPHLIRQTLIHISVRLGLSYQEGWSSPLTIRFVAGSPPGIENVLAYVALTSEGETFQQSLNINLQAYQVDGFDLPRVLAHELVHAMVSDALGADASNLLPIWFHEGIAVYGSNQGEQMLSAYVAQLGYGARGAILNGLEGPHGALDYAEDYLAFQYIYEKHGINSLHNFVREVINRKGNLKEAYERTCFESWGDFNLNLKKFGTEKINALNTEQRRSIEEPNRKPY
jgi:hypothetical protein